MHAKVAAFTAMIMSRCKDKAPKATDFSETVAGYMKQLGPSADFDAAFQSSFLTSLEQIASTIDHHSEAFERVVTSLLEDANKMKPGSKFTKATSGFYDDLRLANLRKILSAIVESPSASASLRLNCVRLMLRLGVVFASAEDLLNAAMLQQKFKLDLR